jgi:RHS repeat-associated protein
LGEVFSFISSLYFRGKIAYVNKFSNPPIGLPPQLIMTTSSGLLPTDTVVTIDDLKGMSRVPIDNSGNVLAKYTQTLSFDDPLAELRSGTTTFYQVDGTKSITSLSDTASTLAGTYVYDAFGNLSSSTGFLTNPFRYTGREFDAETGLYYYRTRYYDSGIGRFASEDSIRFKGGINFYPYVRNRPVTFGDPMGTCLWQFDSVTATLGQCGKDPDKERQCACLCQVSPEYAGCVKDCKDGCLSGKFSLVEMCQCGCDQRHKSGELNGFETWACKQFCKLGGK